MAVVGPVAVRPLSLIALCGDLGWGEATSLRARLGGSRHTTAHYRLQGVSWCTIGWGCENSTSSPGTYSAHVECGGKFSRVWPKVHGVSLWGMERAPIAQLASISIPWLGGAATWVASSQTWGGRVWRGETPSPCSTASSLQSRSPALARSRLRPSSCGVEGETCILGSKLHEDAI